MNFGSTRRDFLRAATATGATIWAGATKITAQAQTPSGVTSPAPATSLPPKDGFSEPVPLAPPDRQPSDLIVPTAPRRKVGWAIVGLGKLALDEVMPAFRQSELSKPVALVSGHPEKAQKVAGAFGINPASIYNYENFDRIAENKEIEVVYIILPNSMHAEYTNRALRAGKDVLCEKPMAVTVDEAKQMIATAEEMKRKLMIAYRLHYEPMNRKVMALCRSAEYGKVKTFASSNCQNVKAPNIRLSKALGGGPLGDIGIYCINAARYVIGEEPNEATAVAYQPTDDPRFREVPESVAFTLRFPSGAIASCDCSFGTSESRRFRVHCAEGFIDLDPAYSYRGLRLHVKHGESHAGAMLESEFKIPEINQFAAEMDHFSDCILNGELPRTPGAMGLADLRVIAAIEESAKTGKAVPIENPPARI